jgi:CTP:molybdopterin cytidylyltransferase MocA
MIRRAARTWLDAGLDPTAVVIPAKSRFREALHDLPVRLVENPEPERGLSHSIALGLAAIPGNSRAALIGVADQPYLTADGLRELTASFREHSIVVARYGDHEGAPAIFDCRFFDELRKLEGDRGGQLVVTRHPDAAIVVELPPEMGRDIDRVEDWPA